MRNALTIFGLLAVLVGPGCSGPLFRRSAAPATAQRASDVNVERVVAKLNANSRGIQSVTCDKVFVDGKSQGQPYTLNAKLAYQSPKNFRLAGKFAGKSEVELGSNSEEIWFWFARAEPPAVYFCKRDEIEHVNLSIPFQPDWILEVMGVLELDPKKYSAGNSGGADYFTLVTRETTPGGKPVIKRLIVDRKTERLRGFELFDGQSSPPKRVAEAWVLDYHEDAATHVAMPRKVEFRWPDQDTQLTIMLQPSQVEVNSITPEWANALFHRQPFNGIPEVDLARMSDRNGEFEDTSVSGYQPTARADADYDPRIRRASGAQRARSSR